MSLEIRPSGTLPVPSLALRSIVREWRGAWVTSTAYAIFDIVVHDGASYLAIAAHTSGASSEPGVGAGWETVWALYAESGADGADGLSFALAGIVADNAARDAQFGNTVAGNVVLVRSPSAPFDSGPHIFRLITPHPSAPVWSEGSPFEGAEAIGDLTSFSHTFNGVDDDFTVPGVDLEDASMLLVFLDSVLQQPTAAYTLSGEAITFTEVPTTGAIADLYVIGNVGVVGEKGEPGGLAYIFDTATADADPGTGKIRANNAALGSATVLYVSDLNVNAQDFSSRLNGLVSGNVLEITTADGLQQVTWNVASVVNAAGYTKVSVTGHAGATAIANAKALGILITPAPGGIGDIVEDTTPQLGGNLDANGFHVDFDDGTGIRDDSGNEYLIFQKTASAINHVEITNTAVGVGPIIAAGGSETDTDLKLSGKGTGIIKAMSTVAPFASDGSALGKIALPWSDLFLASGGVVDFANGNVKITHATGEARLSIGATEYWRWNTTALITGSVMTQAEPGNGNTDSGIALHAGADGQVFISADATAALFINRNSDGAAQTIKRSGTTVGSISVTTTTTTYNTSSDYRLKRDEAPLDVGDILDQLKPYRFTWRATGESGVGFYAHELQVLIPEAVTGAKDGVDPETGEPDHQGVDLGKLVPYLVAEIQSLRARVAALEAGA